MNNQDSSQSDLDPKLKELELSIIVSLTEYRTLSNLVFTDFHGQEEGEDPKFDELCNRERAAYIRLLEAIEALLHKATQEAVLKELERLKYSESVLKAPATGIMVGAIYTVDIDERIVEIKDRIKELESRKP